MLTVKEAAQRLSISRSKLYQKVERREIAHYRIDGKILFSDEQVEEFLAGCRVEVGQVAPDFKFTHVASPSSPPP